MPLNASRARRIAEQIRHELAEIFLRELKDPRIGAVSLTAVELSPELDVAKVYFTMLTGEPGEVQKALGHAAGFLRSELAHRLRLRTVPRLIFLYDESVERGARLSRLIDEVVEQDRLHNLDDETQA